MLGTGAAQDELVPALMHVYAGADSVVGLDVDRDRFDKFQFRSMIDGLLEILWKDDGASGLSKSLQQIKKDPALSGLS